MAITFDANLGSFQASTTGTTVAMTTSAAAASATRIIATVTARTSASLPTVTGISGGSLTWVKDFEHTGGNNVLQSIWSADAPAGLASSTTITATYSGTATAAGITAMSIAGIGGTLSGSPSAGTGFQGTAWSNNMTTTDADVLLFVCTVGDGAAGATGTATAPLVEVHDTWSSTYTFEIITAYQILTASGFVSVAGTFGTALTASWKNVTMGYALAVAAAADPVLEARDDFEPARIGPF